MNAGIFGRSLKGIKTFKIRSNSAIMPRQSPLWYNVVEMLKSITIFTPLPVPLSSGLLLERNLLMVRDRNRTMSSLVLEDMLSLVLARSHTGLLLSLAV